MDYCTIADLISASSAELLIQLTDDASTGAYDSAVLLAEIANGKDEIDPYCRVRYADKMPFTTVPGILKTINIDITLYRLHKRRGSVPDSFDKANDNAMKKLKGISEGTVNLGTEAGGSVNTDTVTFTNKTPEDRIFRAPEGY